MNMVSEGEQQDDGLGGGGRFTTTHWSVVIAAGASGTAEGSKALDRLCRTYWYPLYAYIRRRGYTAHDAQDLTQGFFARLLERNYLEVASPEKGKFRSYLLGALNHFLANEHDRAAAAKRGAGKRIASLDEAATETRYLHEPATDESPDKLFERQWVVTLLEHALGRLREEFSAAGKAEVFDRLKAFLSEGARSGDYGPAAVELGMTAGAVAVTVHRLRQRYRELVRAEVAGTVANPAETEEEIRHLLAVLRR